MTKKLVICWQRWIAFKNKTEKKIKELKDGLDFAKLYMEEYQRRENLRFLGIKKEADTEEDAREVLVGFLKTELGMENADQIEF